MRIEKLHKEELEAFVLSDAFTQLEHIPISRHRAISHSRNPRARAEDILLLAAYEGEVLMGYLGLLPDNLNAGEKNYHFAWMSTIWVNPAARGKGVARSLLGFAMEAYKGRILGTDFTEEAKRIYLKTGHFDLFEKLEGIRLYYRFNLSHLLPPKRSFFKRIKPLLYLTDSVLNFFNWLLPKRFGYNNDVVVKEFTEWMSEHEDFIQRSGQDSPTFRSVAEINWIIKNPWVLQSEQAHTLGKRYHFTSAEKRAYYQSLEIRKNGQKIALLLLFIRNDAMKIPCAFVKPEEIPAVCAEIDRLMTQKKLSMLTVFNPRLKAGFETNKSAAFYKRAIIREYVVGIPFHHEIEGRVTGYFQDGDGDCAFT